MKVLVTGGAGFIGSHLCKQLLEEGYEVICLDNFDAYYEPMLKRGNITPLLNNKGFQLIDGDISNYKLVSEVIHSGVDYVFHYAARAGVRASLEDSVNTHHVNATGTLNMLVACLDSKITKFINASSSSVYGRVSYLPFNEVHPQNPISPYAVSKLAAEHYCRVFSETHSLPVVSLRLFNVYGPRIRPDLAISIFTRQALKGEIIQIFGDGSKTRDCTYIDDVVKANLIVMKNRKSNGKVYNIGGGNSLSINELAEKIIKITRSKSKVIHTNSKQGDVDHTWANIEKARQELGWQPRTDIDSGLNKYLKHVTGIE
ncbi:SDR family NAD(P)-dependent oxidoreductase [Chloroflexota bacterium]